MAENIIAPNVSLVNGKPATTSLAIAECFNKQHAHVMRDIQALVSDCPVEFSQSNFGSAEYSDAQGKPRPMYNVYFDGFMLLVMGYTGKKALAMKLAYIEAFNAMREELERAKAEPVENLDKLPSPDAPISPADQSTLQAIVKAKVEALPRDRRGGLYPQIWSRFNNHFRIARYCQLPQSRMSEAVTYLTQLDVAENGRALPASASAPTELSFRSEFPADMDAGRKDALKKIQHLMNGIAAARDVVSMFCYPAPSVMNTSAKRPLTYAARHDFYAAALDCLSAAHAALEAGYRLNRLHE